MSSWLGRQGHNRPPRNCLVSRDCTQSANKYEVIHQRRKMLPLSATTKPTRQLRSWLAQASTVGGSICGGHVTNNNNRGCNNNNNNHRNSGAYLAESLIPNCNVLPYVSLFVSGVSPPRFSPTLSDSPLFSGIQPPRLRKAIK